MKKSLGLLGVVIIVMSLFLFASCEKERTETNMVIRNWSLVSKTVAGVDVAAACEKNSKWNFKSDGTYVISESCNNSSGTWKLAEDGKTLTLNGITAYKVIDNSLLKLVIEMQVATIGLVRWSFN